MSNSHRKPGPVPGVWVDLKTQITPELDRGLDQLVGLTGRSKASLVRRALGDFEAAYRDLLTDLASGPDIDRLAWSDPINPDIIAEGVAPVSVEAWLRAIRAYAMDQGHLNAFQPWEDSEDEQ
jgi:hypothetical protein